MPVVRVNKTQNYTVMSNYHFKEKNMSLKAKGLLSLMLSLPDNWDYSIAGLVSICKENETAIKSTLKELQMFGYLKISKLMPDKDKKRSRIEYIYDIFEQPQEGKKQEVENQPLEGQALEEPRQLNTKESNIKKLNTNNNREEIYKENIKNEKSNKKQIEEVINLYRSICKSFPQIRSLTDKREKAIKELLKKSSLEEIREGFEKAENTPFLQGQNKDGWRANFDFIIKHEKLIKILEGFYDLTPKPNENKVEEKIYEDNWDEFFREKLGDEYE